MTTKNNLVYLILFSMYQPPLHNQEF